MDIFDGLFGDLGGNPIAPDAPQPQPTISPFTLDFLKKKEGFQPQAAWDYKQYSGGYGSKAQPGQTFTPQTAEAALVRDATPVDNWLSSNVSVPLSPQQKAGLTSFGYNLGTGALQNLLPDINSGNWARVAERMQSYNHAGGLVNQGLVNRRADEANLVSGQGTPMASGNQNQMATAAMFGPQFGLGYNVNPANVSAVPPQSDTAAYGNGPITPAAMGQSGGVGSIVPPLERYNTLANAFTSAAMNSPQSGWGTALRSLVELYKGKQYGNKYDDQQRAYTMGLGQQIANATDPVAAQRIAAMSGSPALQQAALTQKMSPKQTTQEVTVKDPYLGERTVQKDPLTGRLFELDGTPIGATGGITPGQPSVPANSLGTGAISANGQPVQGQKMSLTQAMQSNLTGEDFLKVVEANAGPALANRIRAVANGDELVNRQGTDQNMMKILPQLVYKYDPTFNRNQETARYDYKKAFQNPKSGSPGFQAIAINNFLHHGDSLYDNLKYAPDHNYEFMNDTSNFLNKNDYNLHGAKIDEIADFLGPEAVKVASGGEGGQEERIASASKFKTAKGATQIKTNLAGAAEVAQGKLSSLLDNWKAVMGNRPIPPEILDPRAREILSKLKGAPKPEISDVSSPGAQPQAATQTPQAGKVLTYNPATGMLE